MKAFFDSTGGLWFEGALVGKPAGLFLSTGTQGGGQETTALTAITQIVHHGMVFKPLGYKSGGDLFSMNEVRGGSPYGSGTYSGVDGSRQPSELELKVAKFQGKILRNS
jgi:NAD(P)H dehydrogenase (quinone)